MKKILLTMLGVLTVAFAIPSVYAQQSIPVLTSSDYSSMKKDEVYVIMFSANYCGPCRLAKRDLFPALMSKYAADSNVHFFVLDVEKDKAAADGTFLKDRWGVQGLPTFVVVYNDSVSYFQMGYSSANAADVKQSIETKVNHLK